MSKIFEVTGFLFFIIVFAPSVMLMSFLGIFIPLRFIHSKYHFEHCWLKHKGWDAGFWHFVDTRANIFSFDGNGSKPPKSSINRKRWLEYQKKYYLKEVKESCMDEICPGYTDYIKVELEKVKQELALCK